MRAHASPAETRSFRLISCSWASFFSRAILVSTSVVPTRFLLEDGGELVPPAAAFEKSAQVVARRRVAAIDRADLLPGLDRGLQIAELRLAEAGHFEKLLFAGFGGGGGRPHRLHEDVAQLGVLPLVRR